MLWFLKSLPMDICCTAHVTWPLKLHGPFFSLLSAMSVYVIADFTSVLFERCVFLKETALNYLIVQCQYIQKWEKTLKERLISFHPHLSDVTWRNHCTEINSQNFISVCKEKQQMVLVEVCWSNQQPKLKFVLIQTDKHYGWITRDVNIIIIFCNNNFFLKLSLESLGQCRYTAWKHSLQFAKSMLIFKHLFTLVLLPHFLIHSLHARCNFTDAN